MKHKLSGCLSATLVITAALAGLSSAAVIGGSGQSGYSYTSSISQTSSGTFQLQKFDASLGTLTGVRIDLGLVGWTSLYSLTHNDTVTLNKLSYGATSVSLNLPDATTLDATAQQTLVAVNTTYAGAGTESITPGAAVSDSVFIEQDAAWASSNGLVGTGTKSFSYSGSQLQSLVTSGASTANSLTQNMTGDITAFVTYTYDEVAAVPEPSEFLLGGVPALLGGLMLMRRRRAVRQNIA